MYYVPSSDGVHGSAGLSWREGKKTGTDYLYLGTPLDLERGIFQSKKRGIFTFDFCTGDIGTPPDDFAVPETPAPSGLPRTSFDFGDAFILNAFLHRTGLMEVIDTLIPGAGGGTDTLHALVLFYALSRMANDHADVWYQGSAARLLYPCANLDGRRISEFLDRLGQPEVVQAFHEAHLKFVLSHCSPDRSILVDSTAIPNACGIPLTQLCSHGGEACGQLRLITVVQRKTGYPLYYRAIAGNTPDSVTLDNVIDHLRGMGVDISACIMDGGYYTLSNLDLFYDEEHNLKISYVTRVKSSDKEYKKLVDENISTIRQKKNVVRYGYRGVYIIKKKVYVGKNNDNPAWMYLGLDLIREGEEQKKFMKKSAGKDMDDDEFFEGLSSKGLFCLVSGEDLPCSRILPAYYQRQSAEQLFDYLKNYTKIHPLRNWTEATIQGHILLSYAACCADKLMQSRLAAAGLPFGPRLEIMRTQKCTRYKNRVVVDVPQKPVRETYKALGIGIPKSIPCAGAGLRYVPPAVEPPLDPGAEAGESGAPAGLESGADHAAPEASGAEDRQKQAPVSAEQEETKPKRDPGRPKGSKNKKTLEREARERAEEEARKAAGVEAKPKRGPGRPKGSKNRKTLEREERERAEEEARKRAEEEAKPKRGPGRPKGSKNKKTLEREAEYRAKAGLEPKRGRGRPKGSKDSLKN